MISKVWGKPLPFLILVVGSAMQAVLECTFDMCILLLLVILSFDDMGPFLNNNKPECETMYKVHFCLPTQMGR